MKAIVAVNKDNVIGTHNGMPWHCPIDLEWFKMCTTNHIVVMGKTTFDIVGKPLPNRYNVVLTRSTPTLFRYMCPETEPTVTVYLNPDYSSKPLHIILHELGQQLGKDVWICGGQQVYAQLNQYCTNISISRIPDKYCNKQEGTSYFPPIAHTHYLHSSTNIQDICVEAWQRSLLTLC